MTEILERPERHCLVEAAFDRATVNVLITEQLHSVICSHAAAFYCSGKKAGDTLPELLDLPSDVNGGLGRGGISSSGTACFNELPWIDLPDVLESIVFDRTEREVPDSER